MSFRHSLVPEEIHCPVLSYLAEIHATTTIPYFAHVFGAAEGGPAVQFLKAFRPIKDGSLWGGGK